MLSLNSIALSDVAQSTADWPKLVGLAAGASDGLGVAVSGGWICRCRNTRSDDDLQAIWCAYSFVARQQEGWKKVYAAFLQHINGMALAK